MEHGDVVMTPDGLLGLVEETGAAATRVRLVNSDTRVTYPVAELPVVASAADVEHARAAINAPRDSR